MNIERMINDLIRIEGGYVDRPDDSGGPTKYGITHKTASKHGYSGSVQDLQVMDAKRIYAEEYYIKPGFSLVAELSDKVAQELFDTGVNCGPAVAVKFFQRLLNVLNVRQEFYKDIAVDGAIGRRTIGAFSSYLFHRPKDGEKVFLKALNCLQGARYIELAERREKDEAFIYGWMKNRVEL